MNQNLRYKERAMHLRDLLGGPLVKNPPCNAGVKVQFLVRDLRSHILEQLSPKVTTTEPT